MLQRRNSPLLLQTFLIEAEVEEDGPDHVEIAQKLADSLMWVEGIGKVTVDYLGVESEIGE